MNAIVVAIASFFLISGCIQGRLDWSRAGGSDSGSGNPNPPAASGAGSLDGAFGVSGTVVTDVGDGDAEISAIGIYSAGLHEGKIVAVGKARSNNKDAIAVVRYRADGEMDTTFNTSGIVIREFAASGIAASTVQLRADGGVLVLADVPAGASKKALLLAFSATGGTELGFNGGSNVDVMFGSVPSWGTSMYLSGTSIIVGGYVDDVAITRPAYAAFDSTGAAVSSLLGGAAIKVDVEHTEGGETYAIEHDGTGGFFAVGTDIITRCSVKRWNLAAGSIIASSSVPVLHRCRANDWTLLSSDTIVVAGEARTVDGHNYFYWSKHDRMSVGQDATLAGGNGYVSTLIGEDSAARAIQVVNGKVLLGGYASDGSRNYFTLARYTSDGELDTAFNTSGIATIALGDDDKAFAMKTASSDTVVLAGYATRNGRKSFALTRVSQ